MTLSTRPEPYIIPSYSLTGDLLSYLNCGRQYRYHNRGALPPSKPVQLWFGQFIHGVMEEAFRRWREAHTNWVEQGAFGPLLEFPWGQQITSEIQEQVIARLKAQGLIYRNKAMLELSQRRAEAAINQIGQHLFSLIDQAEVRLRGIREMPLPSGSPRRADYYEVTGVVDVLSSLQLSAANPSNRLLRALLAKEAVSRTIAAARTARGRGSQQFEVILDYKGMRRPGTGSVDNSLERFEWQLQTYAWLRSQQPDARPVLAAVLIFINELVPSTGDMKDLRAEVLEQAPENQSLLTDSEIAALQSWRPGRHGGPPPQLSLETRLKRAIHVVPISDGSVNASLGRFDQVVGEIEASVFSESAGHKISVSWRATPSERNCTVCDFKNFCADGGYQGAPYAP
jgi:hypothetical protein